VAAASAAASEAMIDAPPGRARGYAVQRAFARWKPLFPTRRCHHPTISVRAVQRLWTTGAVGSSNPSAYNPFMELIDYFEKVRARTMRLVACVPPERVDWTYRAGKFTIGDLMRHLASIERWMFAENAQLRPSAYPGHGPELAGGYDEIVSYMKRMHDDSLAIFRSLSPEQLEVRCTTPGGADLRVSKWLRLMIEHEIHHRGQLYLYLAMLDVPTPPLYGLTEEQVKERSTAPA
jgi:uncharacterized damage-inducible protein DinB